MQNHREGGLDSAPSSTVPQKYAVNYTVTVPSLMGTVPVDTDKVRLLQMQQVEQQRQVQEQLDRQAAEREQHKQKEEVREGVRGSMVR